MKFLTDLDAIALTDGLEVETNRFLPYDKMVKVCDIETREEYMTPNGQQVKAIVLGNKILVSQELFDQFRQMLKEI